MSDLREALQQKVGAWKHERGDLYYASQELSGLLAAHPAEPAPLEITPEEAADYQDQIDDTAWPSAESAPVGVEITDEARAAGLEALHADPDWHKPDSSGTVWRANYKRAVDLVLEAAQPFMTSRPALDREAVKRLLELYGVSHDALTPDLARETIAAAVMELTVPVPTEGQIAVALNNDGAYCGDCDYESGLACGDCKRVCRSYARSVLSLLTKGAES